MTVGGDSDSNQQGATYDDALNNANSKNMSSNWLHHLRIIFFWSRNPWTDKDFFALLHWHMLQNWCGDFEARIMWLADGCSLDVFLVSGQGSKLYSTFSLFCRTPLFTGVCEKQGRLQQRQGGLRKRKGRLQFFSDSYASAHFLSLNPWSQKIETSLEVFSFWACHQLIPFNLDLQIENLCSHQTLHQKLMSCFSSLEWLQQAEVLLEP